VAAHRIHAGNSRRRFNHLYGREPGYEDKAKARGEEDGQQEGARVQRGAHQVPGKRRRGGGSSARRPLLDEQQSMPRGDPPNRLYGWLEGSGKKILVEAGGAAGPEASKLTGLDGQKMSKSYGKRPVAACARSPRWSPRKIKTMPTDPARREAQRPPANPDKCPVWKHAPGVLGRGRRQGLGAQRAAPRRASACLECKQPVVGPPCWRNWRRSASGRSLTLDDPTLVKNILPPTVCDKKAAQARLRDHGATYAKRWASRYV